MNALWWLIAFVILLVVEMVTPGLFFFACLAGGALVTALVTWMGAGPLASWLTFFGTSTVLVLGVAPLARRWLKQIPPSPVGLDAMVGRRARVVEAIDPTTGQGQVRVENGAQWRAISDDPIPTETWVQILEVVGTRLRVSLPSDSTSL